MNCGATNAFQSIAPVSSSDKLVFEYAQRHRDCRIRSSPPLNLSMSTTPTSPARTTGFLTLPNLRDAVLIVIMTVVGWKFMNAELKIDLASFSFNDFLALILALFSVALSVAFYFKATEASNQFYDNTYKFTSEMSEILGRIESGFGERLRHLDEGYSGMRDRLDKLPYQQSATLADVKKEEEEIKRKEAEQRALFEDLAQKAKLAQHEKQALFSTLAQKSEELEQARAELRQMQESRRPTTGNSSNTRAVISYVAQKLRRSMPFDQADERLTSSRIQELFEAIKAQLANEAIADLYKLDLIDSNGRLSREANMRLRIELKRV